MLLLMVMLVEAVVLLLYRWMLVMVMKVLLMLVLLKEMLCICTDDGYEANITSGWNCTDVTNAVIRMKGAIVV